MVAAACFKKEQPKEQNRDPSNKYYNNQSKATGSCILYNKHTHFEWLYEAEDVQHIQSSYDIETNWYREPPAAFYIFFYIFFNYFIFLHSSGGGRIVDRLLLLFNSMNTWFILSHCIILNHSTSSRPPSSWFYKLSSLRWWHRHWSRIQSLSRRWLYGSGLFNSLIFVYIWVIHIRLNWNACIVIIVSNSITTWILCFCVWNYIHISLFLIKNKIV